MTPLRVDGFAHIRIAIIIECLFISSRLEDARPFASGPLPDVKPLEEAPVTSLDGSTEGVQMKLVRIDPCP